MKKLRFDAEPLRGAFDFGGLTASLKRCPDTKLSFAGSFEEAMLSDPDPCNRSNGRSEGVGDEIGHA